MNNKLVNLLAAVIISVPLFMIAVNDTPQAETDDEPFVVAWDPGQPGGG
ncbi:hypothetical protein [Terribacillus saccharophilus]